MPNGSTLDCAPDKLFNYEDRGYLFAGSSEEWDHTTLLAMQQCGILTGSAGQEDIAEHIANGTASQLPSVMGGDYYAELATTGYTTDPFYMLNFSTVFPDFFVSYKPIRWEERDLDFPPFVVRVLSQGRIAFSGGDDSGHSRDIWSSNLLQLQFGQQNASTAECLARAANWTITCGDGERPSALNASLERAWVRPYITMLRALSINRQWTNYECAGGIDILAPSAAASFSRLTALKASARSQLTTRLFVSMADQKQDDVYAVYTGILGALFGALALLVTTLFVYALAALKRSLVWSA